MRYQIINIGLNMVIQTVKFSHAFDNYEAKKYMDVAGDKLNDDWYNIYNDFCRDAIYINWPDTLKGIIPEENDFYEYFDNQHRILELKKSYLLNFDNQLIITDDSDMVEEFFKNLTEGNCLVLDPNDSSGLLVHNNEPSKLLRFISGDGAIGPINNPVLFIKNIDQWDKRTNIFQNLLHKKIEKDIRIHIPAFRLIYQTATLLQQ